MNGAAPLQQAQAFLAQLSQQEECIIGALLVSPDGLLIAHHLPPSDQLEKIAAMSTALHALGKEIGAALVLGEYRVLGVHFLSGEVYLISAGECTLMVVSSREMEPALLATLAQQAAKKLTGGATAVAS